MEWNGRNKGFDFSSICQLAVLDFNNYDHCDDDSGCSDDGDCDCDCDDDGGDSDCDNDGDCEDVDD